ncbi:hypothetical protein B0H14DRAFT_819200 [Mycena olivaceomarginata]|nr:hypothetical protein B0H14DRAFT_819200 [Mycena olivaceomarginata]
MHPLPTAAHNPLPTPPYVCTRAPGSTPALSRTGRSPPASRTPIPSGLNLTAPTPLARLQSASSRPRHSTRPCWPARCVPPPPRQPSRPAPQCPPISQPHRRRSHPPPYPRSRSLPLRCASCASSVSALAHLRPSRLINVRSAPPNRPCAGPTARDVSNPRLHLPRVTSRTASPPSVFTSHPSSTYTYTPLASPRHTSTSSRRHRVPSMLSPSGRSSSAALESIPRPPAPAALQLHPPRTVCPLFRIFPLHLPTRRNCFRLLSLSMQFYLMQSVHTALMQKILPSGVKQPLHFNRRPF